MAVACGLWHTIAVDENGHLFGFGDTKHGQLGIHVQNNKSFDPHEINVSMPVRQVAAGESHTAMVTEAGDLLMCGGGWNGQLGLGDSGGRTTPTLVGRALFDNEAVLMVACGTFHTVVATEGGGVYTFGDGWFGRLGHGDEEEQLVPRRVASPGFNGQRIVMVAARRAHTVALSEAGRVFTWGNGEEGQLGHGDEMDQLAPRHVDESLFGGEQVVFVAAGGDHTVAVTAGGRLFTWGDGACGQLGHGDTLSRMVPTLVEADAFGAPEGGHVVMAACGSDHTLVVTQDGGLWACGNGLRLGLNTRSNRHVFERVGAEAFGGARVVAAAAGHEHSAAVTEDGQLWTWGSNESGQLGQGEHAPLSCSVPRCVDTKHLSKLMSTEERDAFRESFQGQRLYPEVQEMIFFLRNFMERTHTVKMVPFGFNHPYDKS